MIVDKISSQSSSSSISWYILFCIKIFSNDNECHLLFRSSRITFNSFFKILSVWFVDLCNISETPIKLGDSFSIIHDNGDIDISQSVNRYSASIVLSGEIPVGIVIQISTLSQNIAKIIWIHYWKDIQD